MARKLAMEASAAELRELEGLLAAHPRYQIALELTQTYWNQHPDTPPTDSEIEEALDRIMHSDGATVSAADPVWEAWQQQKRKTRRRRRRWALSLAIASLAVVAGLWATKAPPKKSPPVTAAARENQVQTHMGTRTNLLLPDGTVVWLNAGSVLTYPTSFSGEKREVTLEGEAFFDVAANATHPFIVHTSTASIRVLGTSFDVKAYERDKTMETTLIKGSIEVTYRRSRIILKPNQKLVVVREDTTVEKKEQRPEVNIIKPTIEVHTGAIIETSWTDNKLIFQDEDFKALAEQMERWYGVTIDFDRRELENLRFTGTFQKETIRQALEALQLTASFKYSITGNQITIYER